MGCGGSKETAKKEAKTAAERKLAWQRIRAALPRQRTAEDKQRRVDLFKRFDESGNGKLSYSEVYSGCVTILKLDEFTAHLSDIVKRAFNKAKDMGTKVEGEGSSDFVEFLEFRLLLCYIYDYFEVMIMFDEIDTSGNMLIEKKEFEKAQKRIAEWGVEMTDPEKTFKLLDKNGSGTVTFDEFAAWASAKKLDADGDPDNEAAK